MWQIKNISKNKTKATLDFRKKQSNELSTHDLSNNLEMSMTTLIRYFKKGLFKKVDGYRELEINGRPSFVVKESKLEQIKKIINGLHKQEDEFSTVDISKQLKVSSHSVSKLFNDGLLNEIEGYREIEIRGHSTFVVNQRGVEQIKKMLDDLKKQEDELSTFDIARKLGVSAANLAKLFKKGVFKNITSYRELEISGKSTFVINKKDLGEITKIVGIPKQNNELSTIDISKRVGSGEDAIFRLYKKGLFSKVKGYREVVIAGRNTFLINEEGMKEVRDILKNFRKNANELSTTEVAARLGMSFVTIGKLFKKGIFRSIPSYRELFIVGKPTFVVKEKGIKRIYTLLENLLWRNNLAFSNFISWLDDNQTTLFPINILTNSSRGGVDLNKNYSMAFGTKYRAQKFVLFPVRDSLNSEYYFYVLPGWPTSLYEMSKPDWEKKPEVITRLDLNKAVGIVIYNRKEKKLVFKEFGN